MNDEATAAALALLEQARREAAGAGTTQPPDLDAMTILQQAHDAYLRDKADCANVVPIRKLNDADRP